MHRNNVTYTKLLIIMSSIILIVMIVITLEIYNETSLYQTIVILLFAMLGCIVSLHEFYVGLHHPKIRKLLLKLANNNKFAFAEFELYGITYRVVRVDLDLLHIFRDKTFPQTVKSLPALTNIRNVVNHLENEILKNI